MSNTMKLSSFGPDHEPDFSLKEWALKARISRENTNSRRFSASNLKSFREETRFSSTTSSPGYTVREEIDPSTYSFTTALKALQAKTMYTWEYLSPDGFTLNSKWNDAEKYICNPLSGEVPLECLSAKTLSARSFRGITSRITMSAPLIYPSHMQQFLAKSPIVEHENKVEISLQDKKRNKTRDVGTQSTPIDLSSGCPTPSIEEISMEINGDSSVSSGKLKSQTEEEVKETREKQDTKNNGGGERKKQMMCKCSNSQGGCLSLKGLWMKTTRHRDKHKSSTNITTKAPTFLYNINGCSKE